MNAESAFSESTNNANTTDKIAALFPEPANIIRLLDPASSIPRNAFNERVYDGGSPLNEW